MSKTKGYIYGCISAASFGLIPLFSLPIMAKGVNYDSVLFYRFFLAAFAIAIMMKVKNESFRVTRRELAWLVGLGLMYSGSALFLFWGYNLMAAGIASTILYIYPVFVTLLMSIFFHEKVSILNVMAIGLAFCGVGCLYLGDGNQTLSAMGIIVVLVSALSYGLYIVGVNKSGVQAMSGTKIAFYSLVVGTCLFLGKAQFTGGIQVLPDWASVINIIMLALVPTVVSCVTMVYSVQYVGSTITSVLGAMEPVTAVFVGIMVFHEPLTFNLMVGIILIITAVTLIILSGMILKHTSRIYHLVLRCWSAILSRNY